nr:hypothetical protein [Sinorhizobium meliloti]
MSALIPEHQHTAAVEQAAMWLSEQNPAPHPVIPTLRDRFGISALEACEAAALSVKFRTYRRAFG